MFVGQDSIFCIKTHHWLDGPGSNPNRGNFLHPSSLVLGSTWPPIQWVPGHSRVLNAWGIALTTHPHQFLRLKKE